jgi:ribosome-associated heat shock protein Hsp15
MRLDQWLWAVRVYKSRSLAVTAIRAGHVRVEGQTPKPAHTVKAGETVSIQSDPLLRTLRVLGTPESRVGASKVSLYAEELTPPSEFARAREINQQRLLQRPAGSGRPTKRDRRALDSLTTEPRWSDGDSGY